MQTNGNTQKTDVQVTPLPASLQRRLLNLDLAELVRLTEISRLILADAREAKGVADANS